MRRNGLWTRASRGMAALAMAGTPLITALSCESTPDGFAVFVDDELLDTFDYVVIETDDHGHGGFFDHMF